MKTTGTALVVYESWFGNTASVAEAVSSGMTAEGAHVECVDVGAAPRGALDFDVVVVGAPTHALGLSRASTRDDAVRRGGGPMDTSYGMREWLDDLPDSARGRVCAAAFDTRADRARRIPFAAARAARRRLRKKGYHLLSSPTGFLVTDTAGPLLEGELDRAAAWGREIADLTQNHLAALNAAARASAPAAH